MMTRTCSVLGIALVAGACSHHDATGSFAAYPGFKTYFTEHSPSGVTPSATDRQLLYRYRPLLYLAPVGQPPIDFYRDYLPATRLVDLDSRRVIADPPSRRDLQARIDDQRVMIDLIRPLGGIHPAAYGRLERRDFELPTTSGPVRRRFTFLSYSFPFAHSGLPSKLGFKERLLVSTAETLLGWDRNDWHELDVYTRCTLVLDERETPVVLILAQHNYHRAYVIGVDIALPPDGRIAITAAKGSNELYLAPRGAQPEVRRTVQFFDHLDYVLSGDDPPLLRADDVVYGPHSGGREVDYALQYLPDDDPFYRFQGFLGEVRPFLGMYVGRSGSPGADYYTLPELLPMEKTMMFSYLHDNDRDDIAAVRRYLKGENEDIQGMVEYGGRRLAMALARRDASRR
ncbi:MAG: hypothetical protein GC138_10105 [Gammaproteobacteria bacterium]|nr:hypothetical protein [Gammaproteobacteria bacterium]